LAIRQPDPEKRRTLLTWGRAYADRLLATTVDRQNRNEALPGADEPMLKVARERIEALDLALAELEAASSG
jgi:hypothetical protein